MVDSPTLRKLSLDPEKLEVRRFAAMADAPNTLRGYQSDWKDFLKWCKKKNHHPMPASPDDVALYARHCAVSLKLKISTVQRRMAAISEAHKRSGNPSPTHEWVVKQTMRRLRREHGTPAKGKSPLLTEDIKNIVEQIPTTLSGHRDKALLLLGFAAALRRSDLVNLDVEDLSKADEGLIIMVRKGKTDQVRNGRKIAIPFGQNPETCPVTAVLAWINMAGINRGPLFRGMTKFDRPREARLSDRIVAEIVKKHCKALGKRASLFSGHSLRSGFATSAAIAGASERSIQKQTGHANLNVLRRYIRDAEVFRDNAVSKLDL